MWGSVDNGQPLHELHNNNSLRTPGLQQGFKEISGMHCYEAHFTKFKRYEDFLNLAKYYYFMLFAFGYNHKKINKKKFKYKAVFKKT